MTLQASGAISLSDIRGEFGGSTPDTLSEYYRGAGLVPDTAGNAGIPESGSISLTDFYNSSAEIIVLLDAGSGAYDVPVGATSCTAYVIAPGGGGGRITIPGGGGGGGGASVKTFTVSDANQIHWSVGVGGIGRTGSTGVGLAGTGSTRLRYPTTVSPTVDLIANPGGGASPAQGGGTGGTSSGGDTNITGNAGQDGSAGGDGGDAGSIYGGTGGGGNSGAGDVGVVPGGGGGGGAANQNGGNGADGRIILIFS